MKTTVVLALFMLTECATAQTATPDVACIKKPGDTATKLSWTAPTHYKNNDPNCDGNLKPCNVSLNPLHSGFKFCFT